MRLYFSKVVINDFSCVICSGSIHSFTFAISWRAEINTWLYVSCLLALGIHHFEAFNVYILIFIYFFIDETKEVEDVEQES